MFEQSIDRVQIQEFKLTFTTINGNFKVYPIARTEKLTSSIKSSINREDLKVSQYQIQDFSKNYELKSAELEDFDDNGHVLKEMR